MWQNSIIMKCWINKRKVKCRQRRRRRRGEEWISLYYCAWHSDQHQSIPDSMTDHFFRTHSQIYSLSCQLVCTTLIQTPILSTQPPSNSGQSDHSDMAAGESRSPIRLDHQDMTEPPLQMSPSCRCQTVWSFCLPCLCRVWVHRNLLGRTRNSYYSTPFSFIDSLNLA